MTCRRILSIMVLFFCWMYFTHAIPSSLYIFSMNHSYRTSLVSADKNHKVSDSWYESSSDAGPKHECLFAYSRLRKRRHSDLQDHLKKQLSGPIVTKILVPNLNVALDLPHSRQFVESISILSGIDPSPLLPPPKV